MPKVLYVDNHLLALHKPSGMLTQPNDSCEKSLEEWGKAWVKQEYEKKGNVFLEAVHRIDRPVSGVVLFAKTSKALGRMQEKIRAEIFKKHYVALVEGHLAVKEGSFEDYLSHDAFCATRGEKYSLLHYKVIEERKSASLVEITLVTGRYHQIRFQFSSRGHAVVGDHKYGSTIPCKEGIALHHLLLETTHPISDAPLVFRSPPDALAWWSDPSSLSHMGR